MKIRMDKVIKAIAAALDIVEGELLGASSHHGKRVAVLCAAMGQYFRMDDDSLLALTSCALLHDNALTEYIMAERSEHRHDPSMKLHCELGQNNVKFLNIHTDFSGFILYHHEWANGLGPYHKQEGEFPLGAELICIADSLDVSRHLQNVSFEELPLIRQDIAKSSGVHYTNRAVTALWQILDKEMLLSLYDDRIVETASRYIPAWTLDIEDDVILHLAEFVTRIIDYKSVFTRRHSTQIANKAWLMGKYYGYDRSHCSQFYLAAALHDLGKLTIPTGILEKPDRLSGDEFRIIQSHVSKTWEMLEGIDGFESIRNWASFHHEKLNGAGYPFGKTADQLDFNSRLLACIDIYQAVSEERPYHPQRSHEDTMQILFDMARGGCIDEGICRDIDRVMAEFSFRDVPYPV
ncbi:MAG: HD domain-containing protein [Treponema sp.]|jgi:HD-GYP domain-containing protein (c-di-GMP phosphodiesterase class II)|nr:HD domain-containing protein [Treponema sp.]